MVEPRLREVMREGPGEWPYHLIPPIVKGLDRLDIDLQHLTAARPFDCDRAGTDMPLLLLLDLGVHRRELRGINERRWRQHFLWAGHGRDGYAAAIGDCERRPQPGLQIAPMGILRVGI